MVSPNVEILFQVNHILQQSQKAHCDNCKLCLPTNVLLIHSDCEQTHIPDSAHIDAEALHTWCASPVVWPCMQSGLWDVSWK